MEKSPQYKFGANAIETLKAAKKIARRVGSPADQFRRTVTVAGASGPICNNDDNQVKKLFALLIIYY